MKLQTKLTMLLCLLGTCLSAQASSNLLIICPGQWQTAASQYGSHKEQLGISVSNALTDAIAGGGTLSNAVLRSFLADHAATLAPGERGAVLFLGDYDSIPSPSFQVIPTDPTFNSDIYYRDLITNFDRDGDQIFGEFSTNGIDQDFDALSFAAALNLMSNVLEVGRIPLPSAMTESEVDDVLDNIRDFERETGSRKKKAMLTAGRIETGIPMLGADSWEFVVRDLVITLTNTFPATEVTTVAHVDVSFTNRTGIDYAVEGSRIVADYRTGQDLIRGLWETNDSYSFLCNVSHGGAIYDFSLRQNEAGLPIGVEPAVIISMSCASYQLGRAAITGELAAAYVGSTAVVTPDVNTALIGGTNMVSARVQEYAVLEAFGNSNALGTVFGEAMAMYVTDIQKPESVSFFMLNKADILRNILGFQLFGDPTLRHERPDRDSDGLLDCEEAYFLTSADNPDSDDDGYIDGHEVVAGTNPTNSSDFLAMYEYSYGDSNVTGRWDVQSGRVYTVYTCTNLTDADWVPLAPYTNLPGITGLSMSLSNTDARASAFYRIGVHRD